MPESLRSASIEHYLEHLASSEPAPGGGAVVALLGAQAAALLAMALRITNVAAGSEDLIATLDAARTDFLTLAERDAEAFAAVIAAYKLPQHDDDAKEERRVAVQDAFKGATQIPLEVMEKVAALFHQAEGVCAVVKPTVASDVGVALQLLSAALKAGRYNLWINLKYIHDSAFKKDVKSAAADYLKGKKARRQVLHKQIREMMR